MGGCQPSRPRSALEKPSSTQQGPLLHHESGNAATCDPKPSHKDLHTVTLTNVADTTRTGPEEDLADLLEQPEAAAGDVGHVVRGPTMPTSNKRQQSISTLNSSLAVTTMTKGAGGSVTPGTINCPSTGLFELLPCASESSNSALQPYSTGENSQVFVPQMSTCGGAGAGRGGGGTLEGLQAQMPSLTGQEVSSILAGKRDAFA